MIHVLYALAIVAAVGILAGLLSGLWTGGDACRHDFSGEKRSSVPSFDCIGQYHVYEQCVRCGCEGNLKRTEFDRRAFMEYWRSIPLSEITG